MKTADRHNTANFDFGRLVESVAAGNASLVNGAAEAVERYYRPAIGALSAEFQKALADPETVMKSSLQVAIMAVVALAEASAANDYANAMVKRDQVARHTGRPDQDLDVVGRALKAGL
jgi:anti-sigma factor ChrR (cupin superfamily)